VSFHLQIKNYRVLQSVDFTPDGVCLIVGPNGCGKTTLLSVIELLQYAFKEGFGNALYHSGGPWGFTHFDLPPDTLTNLTIEKAGFRWELKPTVTSNGVMYPIEETMTKDDSTLFAVEQGASQFQYKQSEYVTNERTLALKRIYDNTSPVSELESFIQPLIHYQHYRYHLWTLRKHGSPVGSENELYYNGENAFSVLRNWQTSKPLRERYEFVISVLVEAFPSFFGDLDFESLTQTVSIRIFPPNSDKKCVPIYFVSNGFLNALLHLMAVCSVPDGSIIGIDEPENGLHPYAIRVLIEALRDRAQEHNLTVLLATHSPLMLNEFKEESHHVYVMEENSPGQIIRLDKLKEPNWLKAFKLGNLYGKEFARMGD